MKHDAFYQRWLDDHRAERERLQRRAERRRELYASDPVWRLTKLKRNREGRLREKLRQQEESK